MSAVEFQRALAELVASPALCLSVREDPERALESYTLSPLERRRLADVVWQRGMSTNCSLYRSNRITPLCTLLERSCFLLGERLAREVDCFWASAETNDVQYQPEVQRFAAYLEGRLRSGAIVDPLLEEVLAFEVAWVELQFSPRRRILESLGASSTAPRLRLHPLVRLVRFRHEPLSLLGRLDRREPPPYELEEGDFVLLLSVVDGDLQIGLVEPSLGERLLALGDGAWQSPAPAEAAALVESGVAVW